MPRLNKKNRHAVLIGLMLIVGSVQAQVTYFCGMLDTVIHDVCCCADSDVDEMVSAELEPCCEKSVGLIVETATDHGQPTTKPAKFESDVDPPHAVAPALVLFSQDLRASPARGTGHGDSRQHTGRTTYLITQRLRI